MICPNCSKELSGKVEYCNECGSKVDGSLVGDFKTDIHFVFKHPDEFVFVNSKNGRQIVLKANSLEDLERKVNQNGFFWVSKTGKAPAKKEKSETREIKKSDSLFLSASSLKTDATIPKMESRAIGQSDDVFLKASALKTSQKKIERPQSKEDSSKVSYKPKKNPDVVIKEFEHDDLCRKYGILGVSREYDNGAPSWIYRAVDPYTFISRRTLERLESEVKSRGLDWIVLDENLADETFRKDLRDIELSDKKIKEKNSKNDIDFEKKSELIRQMSSPRSNENSTELDRMFK
ncbi:hypothetical protein [Methanobrevibacter sp.]|uniref:hypothetical protein n=1 Tax=Methanobrevibacter sp. TaxID=66852 RepID=UPI00388F8F7A